MKSKIYLTTMAIGMSAFGFAQDLKEAEVPSAVKNGFSSIYKGAKAEKWETEDNGYEANFMWDSKKSSAIFDENGSLLLFEQEVIISSLSPAIKESVAKNFVGYSISAAEMIVDPTGVGFYELTLKNGNKIMEVQIDGNGDVMNKSEENTQDEKNED